MDFFFILFFWRNSLGRPDFCVCFFLLILMLSIYLTLMNFQFWLTAQFYAHFYVTCVDFCFIFVLLIYLTFMIFQGLDPLPNSARHELSFFSFLLFALYPFWYGSTATTTHVASACCRRRRVVIERVELCCWKGCVIEKDAGAAKLICLTGSAPDTF